MKLKMLLVWMVFLIFADLAIAAPCSCSDHTEVNGSGQNIGNCLSAFEGSKWGYVSSGSSCSDKKQSSRNDQLFWSVSACQQNTGERTIKSGCVTVGGDDTGASCEFPFIFKNKVFNGCTLAEADDGNPWCSTKVDSQGVHIGGEGKWGHCGQGCTQDSGSGIGSNVQLQDCTCSNHIETDAQGQQTGNCLTQFRGSYWCYLNSNSNCADKKQSKKNPALFWSQNACGTNTGAESVTTEETIRKNEETIKRKDDTTVAEVRSIQLSRSKYWSSLTDSSCDASTWPDLDHGLVCGDCKGLINKMSSKYISCNNYCNSIGRSCSGAWEESGDTCTVQSTENCAHQFTYTSDAICQCGLTTDRTECFSSPGYSINSNYKDHHNIRKTFSVSEGQAMEISFLDFDIEYGSSSCPYDYVQFFDENEKSVYKKFCGYSSHGGNKPPEKFYIMDRKATVEFKTDLSMKARGFQFCVKPDSCGIENTNRKRTFDSSGKATARNETITDTDSDFDGIIGGGETAPNQYPWMVRLDPPGCGGALITDKHILTAKHCVAEGTSYWRGRKVKVGVHEQLDPNDYKEATIKEVKWPDIADHDFAMIILDQPVDLNDKKIGTVCLPHSANEDYTGKKATAMGWGDFVDKGTGQSPVLRHVVLDVSTRGRANYLHTEVGKSDDGVQAFCHGDSGGPLVNKDRFGRWHIIGTANGYWGDKCTTATSNLWNRITAHLTWIKDIIHS